MADAASLGTSPRSPEAPAATEAEAPPAVTPVAVLDLVVDGRTRPVHLKLEGESPSGSIKDRTARWLVRAPEVQSRLRTSSRMIESTSGNLGVSLGGIARRAGFELIAVVDPRTPPEIAARMVELGVRLEVVDRRDRTGGFLLTRLARVRELCASDPDLVWPNQYEGTANPMAHERETGPEIFRQLDGAVDVVFAAVSTGGTLSGIARFFRRASPRTRLVAVDVEGSVALGGMPGRRPLSGIGASRRSHFLTSDLYDAAIAVAPSEAVAMCHAIAAGTGLRLGGSSGATLAATRRYLRRDRDANHVICVCADGGERYESTVYDRAWLARNGLLPALDVADRLSIEAVGLLGDALPRPG